MDVILNQIERALERGFHYLAVVNALTLPDICAALEAKNGETTKAKYVAWYDTWVAAKFPYLSAQEMYRLRCGVVHQGILAPNGMRYDRIIFGIGHGNIVHNFITADNGGVAEAALNLDASIFCRDLIQSVRDWYIARKNDPNVIANLPRLLQFRPQGLPPHVVGVPIIA